MALRGTGGGSNHFMRRMAFLLTVALSFLFISASISLAQVNVRMRAIKASNFGQGIDPSLKDVHRELGSLFSFTSYRLLRDENLYLTLNQPVPRTAREGRIIIETTLVGLHRSFADLRIRVIRLRTDILNTQVRLSPGRTVLIGGPRLREGVIIYALSGNFY